MRTGYFYVIGDEEPVGPFDTAEAALRAEQCAQVRVAMDRKSTRAYDADGRLRVALTNISKANVCPYKGSEIPGWQQQGLSPDRVYMLYRHPEELAKAAPTFNSLPLLSEHVPVTVDAHRPELVVGSTGTDATFDAPYLRNSLVVWTREAIDAIEDETKKELSSAYRYRADMTSGVTPEGEHYDGVMRDIVGNHVALVVEGRAGADVVVGDGTTEELAKMSKTGLSRKATLAQGALLVFLPPRIAQDAKLPDFGQLLKDVNAKNFAEKKTGLLDSLRPLLAKDASVEGLAKLLDHLDEAKVEDEDPPMDPGAEQGEKIPGLDDSMHEKLAVFLRDKLSPEDLEAAMEMMRSEAPAGEDEEVDENAEGEEKPDGEKKPAEAIEAKPAEDEEEKDKMSKEDVQAAMDAALKKERDNYRAAREAERAVRPWVGEIAVACDSAEQVYRAALEMLGVDHKAVKDAAALPILLRAQRKPGDALRESAASATPGTAMDAASVKSFNDMFPAAAHVRALG